MNKVNNLSKARVAFITKRYQSSINSGDKPASLRAFATWLSDALRPYRRTISHQSIKNWIDQRYLPDRSLLYQIAQGAMHDHRGDFAQDLLAAIDEESFQPATPVGAQALTIYRKENR